ncbi:galactose-specific lectin nattectin-like, partial [Trachinotus anak]|uniref:galactose-specific lectin nattectin-like n=1 Tax=Trachinotus anak TaxID=443729 RepID=UPI0039F17319
HIGPVQSSLKPSGRIKNTPNCPPGWTQFGSRCFIHFFEAKSWISAERYCISIGGNLASVHSAEEHAFIRDMIHRGSGRYRETWIRGFDAVQEGVWMWSDGSRFNYIRWAYGQPNNLGGAEHCIQMNRRRNFWGDEHCSVTNPFVCSKNI